MRIAAILVAAGTGSRFGADMPKQFLTLCGKPVIRHAAEALAIHASLLQPVGDADPISRALHGVGGLLPIVPGGATRQDSVRAGLEALEPFGRDIVLVHDAARPFIPEGTVPALLAALRQSPGAIPAAPVADTLKRVVRGVITETVPRAELFRAQTPQAFRFRVLLEAHRSGLVGATDDASLLEAAGLSVAVVPGSDDNIKLTYPEDLVRLERIMAVPCFPVSAPASTCMRSRPGVRWCCAASGAARHGAGRAFGCRCRHPRPVRRDLWRAGRRRYRAAFPAREANWKDADSARFLTHAAERIAARGGRLANADVTLICERPKITPHAPAMIERLASLLGVEPGRISVKATTTERLGFTGRGEGIAAQAAVSILLPE